jgi:hypothetical protein
MTLIQANILINDGRNEIGVLSGLWLTRRRRKNQSSTLVHIVLFMMG